MVSKESGKKFRTGCDKFTAYEGLVCDILENETVRTMDQFIQHSDVSCLEHSLHVSYLSYTLCRKLGLDYVAAARAGLLHDFFLYDWHVTRPEEGLHGFVHPARALRNADHHFSLRPIEKDIIEKHMWPLTLAFPSYRESFVVSLVDKYCSLLEIFRIRTSRRLYEAVYGQECAGRKRGNFCGKNEG